MPLVKLELENMHELKGGLVALMFDKAIRRAVEDIEGAPDIDDARTVELFVKMKPVREGGRLEEIDFEVGVKGRVPSRSTSLRMVSRSDLDEATGRRQMSLFYQADAPDNPFQPSVFGDQSPDDDDDDRPHG